MSFPIFGELNHNMILSGLYIIVEAITRARVWPSYQVHNTTVNEVLVYIVYAVDDCIIWLRICLALKYMDTLGLESGSKLYILCRYMHIYILRVTTRITTAHCYYAYVLSDWVRRGYDKIWSVLDLMATGSSAILYSVAHCDASTFRWAIESHVLCYGATSF